MSQNSGTPNKSVVFYDFAAGLHYFYTSLCQQQYERPPTYTAFTSRRHTADLSANLGLLRRQTFLIFAQGKTKVGWWADASVSPGPGGVTKKKEGTRWKQPAFLT